ncbi:MAG: hypothetical protein ACOH18_03850 [Candidatus Saccharimonadaceae bacterium]
MSSSTTVSSTVSVSIAGAGSSTINLDASGPRQTIRDVVKLVLGILGKPAAAADHLSAVVDGQDAELDDTLPDDATTVSAAPAVANG